MWSIWLTHRSALSLETPTVMTKGSGAARRAWPAGRNAEIALTYCRIYGPIEGRITRVSGTSATWSSLLLLRPPGVPPSIAQKSGVDGILRMLGWMRT